MTTSLKIVIGQHSDKGRKEINQDFHGAYIPQEPLLSTKGICVALADGISSSKVSHIASESAVSSFFADYYCTSEAWTVKTSAQRVLNATNSWLHSQTQRSEFRYDKDKGYVCTFSAIIFKSSTAHIFHAGDARIYRVHKNALEQLTKDHRVRISEEQTYLSRALGIDSQLDLDYCSLQIDNGDMFILLTDGVYEFVNDQSILASLAEHSGDLDAAAKHITQQAYLNGSKDNLTVQLVRVVTPGQQSAGEIYQKLTELPFPPALEARMLFDGYKIIRQLYASARSHVFLAIDEENGEQVVLKTPAVDMRNDIAHLERFLLEEWIARRINSAHVLKPANLTRKRKFFYIATEYIEGQTLTQWMIDHPKPDVETVRGIVEQITKGLRAFHKLEMLHQDVRPENILIDNTGTVKIIDFGSTRVAGLSEQNSTIQHFHMLGTAQYTAPEYFLGDYGSARSDQFSLAVIAYQMLSGRLPYGAKVAQSRTRAAQRKLVYHSVLHEEREIPVWVDEALRKALHPNPLKRYEEISEFMYDLRHPNEAFLNRTRAPLLERNPVAFWQGVSLLLMMIVVGLLFQLTK